MNKKLIGFLLILTLPLSVLAVPQNSQDAFHHGKHRIERLTKELSLTPEQVSKVESLLSEQKAKIKAIHNETKSLIQAILTPEQVSKFEKMTSKKSHEYEVKSSTQK